MEYYIYDYIYNNEIVYIGKTNNLQRRINEHCKEIKFYGLTDICYYPCKTKEEMELLEIYLINLYKPILNYLIPSLKEIPKYDVNNWKLYNKNIEYEEPLVKENFPMPIYSIEKTEDIYYLGYGYEIPIYEINKQNFCSIEDLGKISGYWNKVRDEIHKLYEKRMKELFIKIDKYEKKLGIKEEENEI